MTNYNDAAVMRLLVERPTVFATEIPRSIEGEGGGGTAKGHRKTEKEREIEGSAAAGRARRKPVPPFSPLAFIYESPRPAQFRIRSRLPNLAYLAYP